MRVFDFCFSFLQTRRIASSTTSTSQRYWSVSLQRPSLTCLPSLQTTLLFNQVWLLLLTDMNHVEPGIDGENGDFPTTKTQNQNKIKKRELTLVMNLPLPGAAGCLVAWPRLSACRLTLPKRQQSLGLEETMPVETTGQMACKSLTCEGLKQKNAAVFSSLKNSSCWRFHCFTSHSFTLVSQTPHHPSLSLSLRHGQGRISRQRQSVQTLLYDRKDSQAWERNFPSELTHPNAYMLPCTQTHTHTCLCSNICAHTHINN